MSDYFEKARELGNLILASEESKRVADANEEYQKDEAAVVKMKQYQDYYAKVQSDITNGQLSQEEIAEVSSKLSNMAAEIKLMPSMAGLIYAENELNELVNKVMKIFQSTITGIDPDEGGCPSSGCSSCSGCK